MVPKGRLRGLWFALALALAAAPAESRGRVPNTGPHNSGVPHITPLPDFRPSVIPDPRPDLTPDLNSDLTPDLGSTVDPGVNPGADTPADGDITYAFDSSTPSRTEVAPNSESVWRENFTQHVSYADGIGIGALSQLKLDMAVAALDAPLTARPAVLALLHPEADATDIELLRDATPSADIAVITDIERADQQMRDAIARFKGRPVLVVGHLVSWSGSDEYNLENADQVSEAAIGAWAIQEAADANDVWVILAACDSAGPRATGTLRDINTEEVAQALPAVFAANTRGGILRAIAGVGIPMGIDAENVARGELNVYFMRNLHYPNDLRYTSMRVRIAPPELPAAFRVAAPNGCTDDIIEKATCDEMKEDVDSRAPEPSFLQYWPWALGGLVALLIFWPRRRY